MAETFAQWVYRLRRNHFTQASLAARLGVAQATVAAWEVGRSYPRKETVKNLEDLFSEVLGLTTAAEIEENVLDVGNQVSEFGLWLQATRNQQGLTVAELAEISGLTSATINNIESGRSQSPQAATQAAISGALSTKVPTKIREILTDDNAIEGLGLFTDFDPHDPETAPSVAGVYIFYDITGRPVYVGESGSIQSRVRQHINDPKKDWYIGRIVETASYVEVPDTSNVSRFALEKLFLRALKSYAIFNKQHVRRNG